VPRLFQCKPLPHGEWTPGHAVAERRFALARQRDFDRRSDFSGSSRRSSQPENSSARNKDFLTHGFLRVFQKVAEISHFSNRRLRIAGIPRVFPAPPFRYGCGTKKPAG
jgi:hypothetical protein